MPDPPVGPDAPPPRRVDVEAGLVWAAVVALVAYAGLRVAGWLAGEPDPRLVLASAHVAWYWRVATATWWGVLAGVGGARFGGLRHAIRLLPVAVAAAVAQAVFVP